MRGRAWAARRAHTLRTTLSTTSLLGATLVGFMPRTGHSVRVSARGLLFDEGTEQARCTPRAALANGRGRPKLADE